MTSKITEQKADIALLITAIIWGAALLPVSIALKTNGVFTLLFWRFLLSAIFMGLIALKFGKFDKRSIKNGVILGITLFVGTALQTSALKYTYSSSVSFIVSLYVVIVPFLSLFLLKKRVSIFSYFGIALGIIGLFMMQKNFHLGLERGEILALLSAFCLAFHIIFTGIFARTSELFAFLTAQFFTIAIFSFIASFVFANGMVATVNTAFINAIIITVFFSTIIGFGLEGLMLRYTTPTKAAIIFIFKSVTAGFVGYFFGKEELSTTQICGAFVILLAILISEIGTIKSKK